MAPGGLPLPTRTTMLGVPFAQSMEVLLPQVGFWNAEAGAWVTLEWKKPHMSPIALTTGTDPPHEKVFREARPSGTPSSTPFSSIAKLTAEPLADAVRLWVDMMPPPQVTKAWFWSNGSRT